ncbi:MAG: DMT family transporter [Bacteroidia bacterium]|nr:DMT family transporter [Bacteroidia bacterium]MDW8345983.1 DMT family transporter [Bacteroidia bacterium]
MRFYLLLHLAVLLWGLTAILGKVIHLTPVPMMWWRTLLTSVSVGMILLIQSTSFCLPTPKKVDIRKMAWIGFLVAVHWLLFYASVKVSNASVCLAGFGTGTLFTAILEPLMNKKSLHWVELIISIWVMIAIYILAQADISMILGLTLSAASAFFSSLFTILNKKLSHLYSPFVISFYEMVFACGILTLFLVLANLYQKIEVLPPSFWDWVYLIVLSLFCTVIAFSISVFVVRRLSAFMVTLTTNLEPVYGMLIAYFSFPQTERMNTHFYVGAVMLIGSIFVYLYLKKRKVR